MVSRREFLGSTAAVTAASAAALALPTIPALAEEIRYHRIGTAGNLVPGANEHRVYLSKNWGNQDAVLHAQAGETLVATGKVTRSDGSFVSFAGVASGQWDAWIRTQLTAFRDNVPAPPVGKHYFGFYHEPEGEARDLGSDWSPANYAAATRRVHDIGISLGLDVWWVWVLVGWTFEAAADPHKYPNWTGNPPDAFYPGDAYLDAVGADCYNDSDARIDRGGNGYATGAGPWKDVPTLVGPPLAYAAAHTKQMVIAELGCPEVTNDPAKRARWIHDGGIWIMGLHRIRVLNWFNLDWRPEGSADWRLAGPSLTEYENLVANPYFRAA